MLGLAAFKNRASGRKVLGLVLLAVVARAVPIALLLARSPGLYQWRTNEVGVVARSLLLNHNFASPYHDSSGPTAWIAPAYAGIVSIIFSCFGIQTPLSAIVAIAFNALCSALVCLVLCRIGSESFDERMGVTAALLWAVSPAMAVLSLIIWDTCFTTLLIACAIWLTLRLKLPSNSQALRSYAGAGALWGLVGLSSPSCLAPVPFLALWMWRKGGRLRQAAAYVAAAVAVLLPWTLRNFLVFHKFVPVRDNFWAEVFFGNLGFEKHPLGNSMDYQRLGEQHFIEGLRQQVLLYIHHNCLKFAEHSLHRAVEFWTFPEGMWGLSFLLTLSTFAGLYFMFKRKRPAAPVFAIILATYPVTYYASYAFSRYRHPIEPVMYLSSAFLLVEVSEMLSKKRALSSAQRA